MKFRLTILLTFICFYSQGQNNQKTQIIPVSPNASMLGKFGDTPIELYNGTVDISVPVYTIKEGDIEIPLTFNYFPSGIKVQQEASWVGLGWNFSPAGAITRTIVGGEDSEFTLGVKDFYKDLFLKAKRGLTQAEWDASVKMRPWLLTGDMSGDNLAYNDYKLYYERVTTEGMDGLLHAKDEQILITAAAVYGQGQPDIFYVNCPGLSFQFFIDVITDKPVILNPKGSIQIEGSPLTTNKWIITNEKGFKYYFDDIQETFNASHPVITSWLLSKIVSPSGNTVNFNYQNYGDEYPVSNYYGELTVRIPRSEFLPSYEGTHAKLFSHQISDHADANNTSKNYYLTSIKTAYETVNFNLQTRTDIDGKGARSLKSIDICKVDGQKLRTINCNYDYFNYSTIGSSYNAAALSYNSPVITRLPSPISDFISRRLKLTGIDQLGYDNSGSKSEGKHSFSYIEDYPLPLKTSCAIDHWGYYNGQNNTGILPDISWLASGMTTFASESSKFGINPIGGGPLGGDPEGFLTKTRNRNIPLEFIQSKGANRAADETYMMQGMLKNITYPTGGSVSFTWEGNHFKNFRVPTVTQTQNIITAVANIPVVSAFLNDYTGANTTVKSFDFALTRPTTVKVVGELIKARNPQYPPTDFSDIEFSTIKLFKKDASGKLSVIKEYAFNGSNSLIKEQTVSGVKKRVFDTDIPLFEGSYVITAEYVASDRPAMVGAPELSARFSYKLKTEGEAVSEALGSQDFTGAGLRIKEIIKNDQNGKSIGRKTIKYLGVDNNQTSGILMSPLNYVSSKNLVIGSDGVRDWILHSTSYVPLSSSAKGNLVGYSSIVEEDFDDKGITNGKTVNEYNNNPSRYFADLPTVPDMTNGLLRSSKTYKGDVVLNESIYNYKKLRSEYYRNFVVTLVVPTSDLRNLPTPDFSDYSNYYISYYPLLSELNVLDTKNETSYTANPAGKVTVATNYDYSPIHFQPVKTIVKDSRDYDNVKLYNYPQEMVNSSRDPNGVYQGMIDKNIVSPVIEQSTTLNGSVSLSRTNYIQPYTGIYVPGTVEGRNAVSGKDEILQRFHAYDNSGKPLSISQENGLKTSYKWGYSNHYPTAEVKNAGEGEFYTQDFEEKDGVAGDAHSGARLFNGSYTVNWTIPNSRVYKIGYFYYAGGVWSYKEEDYTANSKLLSGGTAYDDIRIFPVDALISTYTYEPSIGLTSSIDSKGQTVYYEYDDLQRLRFIRDQKRNIIKSFDYHYKQ